MVFCRLQPGSMLLFERSLEDLVDDCGLIAGIPCLKVITTETGGVLREPKSGKRYWGEECFFVLFYVFTFLLHCIIMESVGEMACNILAAQMRDEIWMAQALFDVEYMDQSLFCT
ncbi:hypothetical protein BJY00DRAFT_279192 [Aspergillus carlsbadensis]|nr:hypothetical protein BJY00DRAFT_279192 [Aspergillus carlsbadensis]